jgi:hypothetical protein
MYQFILDVLSYIFSDDQVLPVTAKAIVQIKASAADPKYFVGISISFGKLCLAL